MARDNFPKKVVETLAKRAGHQCSKCKRLTVGPSKQAEGIIVVGVAAHIRAASPGGARFEKTMSPAQRKAISNGIWLCQDDAKLVDDDEEEFTVALLERMKAEHEADIKERVTSGRTSGGRPSDREILGLFAAILDRPALSEPFGNCRQPDFQKAVSDVIEALNTGVHRLRDGTEIRRVPSRHELRDDAARSTLAEIVGLLVEVRALHARLVQEGTVKPCGCTAGPEATAHIDQLRARVLTTFQRIYPTFGVRVRQAPA